MKTITAEKLTRQQIDALVGNMFQDPGTLRDFVMARLNPHIFAALDPATLQLENTSVVEDEFRKRYSDFVISAEVNQKKFYLHVLIQHGLPDIREALGKVIRYSYQLGKHHIYQVEAKAPVILNFMLYAAEYRRTEPEGLLQVIQDPVILANALQEVLVFGLVKEYGVGVPKATKPDLVDLIIKYGSSPKKDENP